MRNLVKTQILISDLQHGMTVEYNNQLLTVSKKDISYNNLFGRYSFRGDMSKQKITRVQFAVPTAFGVILR